GLGRGPWRHRRPAVRGGTGSRAPGRGASHRAGLHAGARRAGLGAEGRAARRARADARLCFRVARGRQSARPMRAFAILLVLLTAALFAPAAAAKVGIAQPREPTSLTVPPPGFVLNGKQAITQAARSAKVRHEAARGPGLRPHALLVGFDYWLIEFARGNTRRAEVEINGRTGKLKYATAGRELDWPPLARGERGPYARAVHKLMVLAGVLFLIPFVSLRRPLRLLDLDLLAILGLGLSFGFAEAGNIYVSTPLRYVPFVYLAV